MDDSGIAGVLGGDAEVDEMRHDAEMSNVRSACSCSSWNVLVSGWNCVGWWRPLGTTSTLKNCKKKRA
jgi:hypothetical protein